MSPSKAVIVLNNRCQQIWLNQDRLTRLLSHYKEQYGIELKEKKAGGRKSNTRSFKFFLLAPRLLHGPSTSTPTGTEVRIPCGFVFAEGPKPLSGWTPDLPARETPLTLRLSGGASRLQLTLPYTGYFRLALQSTHSI
ncbi:hypothetical protein E1301_Tti006332 [Triplophysa tibetana]|uniref:Uncharacterized protein n=1 Tax=Triplophysa tibetana TaxID=1572043 RepID=A0A5A9NT17_9TELE|nr:hypothetical protein E1301_Tti006332 [Triplophysa tibetana]